MIERRAVGGGFGLLALCGVLVMGVRCFATGRFGLLSSADTIVRGMADVMDCYWMVYETFHTLYRYLLSIDRKV